MTPQELLKELRTLLLQLRRELPQALVQSTGAPSNSQTLQAEVNRAVALPFEIKDHPASKFFHGRHSEDMLDQMVAVLEIALEKGGVSRYWIIKRLGVDGERAWSIIRNLYSYGFIKRVNRGFYVLVDPAREEAARIVNYVKNSALTAAPVTSPKPHAPMTAPVAHTVPSGLVDLSAYGLRPGQEIWQRDLAKILGWPRGSISGRLRRNAKAGHVTVLPNTKVKLITGKMLAWRSLNG